MGTPLGVALGIAKEPDTVGNDERLQRALPNRRSFSKSFPRGWEKGFLGSWFWGDIALIIPVRVT